MTIFMGNGIMSKIIDTASQTNKATLFVHFLWLLIISASFCATTYNERHIINHIAETQADTIFKRDQVFRHWSAAHGGAYVPTTEATPPNPHLKQVPFRDIQRPDGLSLTLMNPAYMLRQINELSSQGSDDIGHITPFAPIE